MLRRHVIPLVLLIGVTACQDTPLLTPPSDPDEPERAVLGGGASDLRSGYDFVCTLRSGVVVCFGERDEGQPIGAHRASTGSIVQVDAGATHVCGLRSDGAVQCWGSNEYGQAPGLQTASTGSFVQVSGGLAHSCAVRTDGSVECWGLNDYGQAPPVKAPQTGKFTQVNASAHNSCALRSDGVIECWGHHTGAPAVRTAPSGKGVYAQLADGIATTNCAITTDGTFDCWGYVGGFFAGPFVQAGSAGTHRCALLTTGIAQCWGYPLSWQGPAERSITDHAWPRISVGSYHTCGLRPDGYFECFGFQSIGSNAPDVVPDRPTHYPPETTLLVESSRIRIEWADVNSNELRTEVERSVADSERYPTTWTRVGVVGVNRHVFDDSVQVGRTYVHRVRVCNDAGCSEWAESEATAFPPGAPPVPSSVSARGYSCDYSTCATVSWAMADITFVERYQLFRRSDPGTGWTAWQNMSDQSRTTTSYSNFGLTPGVSYQYRIRACNARGCSAYRASNIFVAPTPPPPARPEVVEAYWMGNYMLVSWSDVATETSYQIQRRQQSGDTWGSWTTPLDRYMNTTSIEDFATPNGVFQYRVRACNAGGCSSFRYSEPTQT
jgi:hypothetical protein